MWTPVCLKLINFRSFVDQEYAFQKGAFLVQGINKTEIDSSSNGSGKSSLQIAICYVLDLPFSVSSLTDLVNNNAKYCKVEFTLKNEKLRQELVIIKETPMRGSSNLDIKLNGDSQKNKFATVLEGHKLIIELIGISKEDLINYYIISKEKYKSFFSSSDTVVKELIGRFSNFNRIDGVEDIVEIDINKLESNLGLGESDLSKLQGKIELLQEQLETEMAIDFTIIKDGIVQEFENIIVKHEETIQGNKSQIKSVEKKIKLFKQQITVEKVVLNTYKEELITLRELNYKTEIIALNNDKKKFKEQCKDIDLVIGELISQIKEFNVFKIEVETAIGGSIKCPKCLYEFLPNNEMNIEEAKLTLPKISESVSELNNSLIKQEGEIHNISQNVDKLNHEIEHYEIKITEFNNLKGNIANKKFDKESEINQLIVNVKSEEAYIYNSNDTINQIELYIEQAKQNIIKANNKEVETREKEIQGNLDKLAKEVIAKEDTIQSIKNNRFKLEQWVLRFKKFRSYLANESLEIISGYANMYLQKMKTDLQVQLQGYKILKNGEVREKITPVILRAGSQEGTGGYRKFSGGERGKIDFAIIIALQNLINNTCHTGGLNILFTDEITESIDGVGLENLVASINDLEKICLVISHVNHDKVYKNIITIEKINGISCIV